ncbi:uncharacterized protein [Onthophagus taurus]|uniref:uncharacterized protein n=1 Tax=Onthophagus taurus TaxID=166361 RepID=UPI000C20594B|nr:uncharacterized protein LOC111414439 [Onthophagus taurus]
MGDSFLTNHKKDFKWPSDKPIMQKPAQPPMKTKQLNFFLTGPVESMCGCGNHTYDTHMKRYEKLAEKEKILHEELSGVNEQMITLSSEMIDNSCDVDDILNSTYQIDYIKRGLNVAQYTKLMPAVDSPVGVPVKSQSIGIGDGYRDPTSFRYTAFNRPTIDPCPTVTFATSPANLDAYFKPTTGRSEYQDSISKMGLSIIKSRQQYKEPLPSSRRRTGDPCL